jgi:hypothetical protein
VWRLVDGPATYWAVAAAAESGVLAALDGGATADEVADAVGGTTERLLPLLDVLVATDVVERHGDLYRCTPSGDLARTMAPLLAASPGRHANWLGLAAVLRGAAPSLAVDGDAEFRSRLVGSTFAVQHALASRVAARLAPALGPSARVVDVASGAAPWAIALLQASPGARAVCTDLAGVLDVTADSLTRHGCGERATLVAGPPGAVELPPDADVVVLANVCRDAGGDGAAELIARAAAATRPGGWVVVADYFTDADDPDRARRASVLGLTMVANTHRGTTFAQADYRRWLAAAGLTDVELLDGRPAPHDALLGRRPTAGERTS